MFHTDRYRLLAAGTGACEWCAVLEGFQKNLEFLANVYKELIKERENVNLIITGDGPYLTEYKEVFKENKRVIFTKASRAILLQKPTAKKPLRLPNA